MIVSLVSDDLLHGENNEAGSIIWQNVWIDEKHLLTPLLFLEMCGYKNSRF